MPRFSCVRKMLPQRLVSQLTSAPSGFDAKRYLERKDGEGRTPLMVAAGKNFYQAAKLVSLHELLHKPTSLLQVCFKCGRFLLPDCCTCRVARLLHMWRFKPGTANAWFKPGAANATTTQYRTAQKNNEMAMVFPHGCSCWTLVPMCWQSTARPSPSAAPLSTRRLVHGTRPWLSCCWPMARTLSRWMAVVALRVTTGDSALVFIDARMLPLC
jgi:hypothetical protein